LTILAVHKPQVGGVVSAAFCANFTRMNDVLKGKITLASKLKAEPLKSET
jgi:hypothetical protein